MDTKRMEEIEQELEENNVSYYDYWPWGEIHLIHRLSAKDAMQWLISELKRVNEENERLKRGEP